MTPARKPRSRMSVRSEMIAYRARNWCAENGWEHTLAEIAAAIGERPQAVNVVFSIKGWHRHIRHTSPQESGGITRTRFSTGAGFSDRSLDELFGARS